MYVEIFSRPPNQQRPHDFNSLNVRSAEREGGPGSIFTPAEPRCDDQSRGAIESQLRLRNDP